MVGFRLGWRELVGSRLGWNELGCSRLRSMMQLAKDDTAWSWAAKYIDAAWMQVRRGSRIKELTDLEGLALD